MTTFIQDRIHQIKTLIRFAFIWTISLIKGNKVKHRLWKQKWYNYGMPIKIRNSK